MKDLLGAAIIRLFNEERFYAELVLQMDRIINTNIPTIGVCIKDKVQLHVNPEFFANIPLEEQVAVLKHECKHILHEHIPRAKELAPEIYNKPDAVEDAIINTAKHKTLNVAMDCSINPGIPNAPKEGCFPKNFDLPDNNTMEWYLENLKDNEKLKHLTEYDGHSLWAESEGEKEELKEKIKSAVNKAAKSAKNAGSMSYEDQLLVDRLNYKPRDWKADLRRFAARSLEILLATSKKKRNRRYGILYPGVIKEEKLHIGVAIDTSGSISDEMLSQFMAEVGQIAKSAIVTVVEADCEVKNSYLYDPKKVYKIKGRGGTAYQPAFDYFTNETDVDGVIYLGDMDCFDAEPLKKPKYPVLWAIVGNQKPPASWGSVTKVEVNKKS